jgi:hypothetical protein
MTSWLFLRGEWDCRTQKSIDDNDDMWLQLFMEITKDKESMCDIVFKNQSGNIGYNCTYSQLNIEYEGNEGSKPAIHAFDDVSCKKNIGKIGRDYDFIFSRGGFDYYLSILNEHQNAYKIRYGAGRRYMPESDIKYDLVLVDTIDQKKEVLARYPDYNVHLWTKPAAKHFEYMSGIKKEYDVCYIANEQQRAFKGVDWAYDTAPRDLKILHLGYHDSLNPPENVTCKRVDRIDMPKWINKCKVGIVPYSNVDSCPRVIPEILACGLPIFAFDSVNVDFSKYVPCNKTDENNIWNVVCLELQLMKDTADRNKYSHSNLAEYYNNYLSIEKAATHIKSLINI